LGLPDRQQWLVAPVSRNRDSDPLAESNFAACLESLGGESDNVEVHRFGHWGCGWFEIILAAPSLESEVDAIASALADYPVLDDSDYSSRECEALSEAWENYGSAECAEKLCEAFGMPRHVSPMYEFLRAHSDELHTLHSQLSSGDYLESSGAVFGYGWISAKSFTRDRFAAWIRSVRMAARAPLASNASEQHASE
jgi:hypothetical protein